MNRQPAVASAAGGRKAGAALQSKWGVRVARAGILSRAANYLILGVVVGLVLLGRGGQEVDKRGAVETVAGQPFGRVLLVVLCAGFIAYIVWHVLRAASREPGQSDAASLGHRLVALVTVVIYGGFLFTGVRVLVGSQTASPQSSQQTLTARLLSDSGGRLLVGLGGAVIIGIGLGLFVYAAMRKFEGPLDTARMGPRMRRAATVLGIAGGVGRGLVFVIIGGFVVSAAISANAAQSKGLDQSLRTLAGQPFGTVMLTVVALGFLAFGLWSIIDARYHRDFSR